MTLSVLLHIPHSSLLIPSDERAEYVVDAATLDAQNLALSDMHTHELYVLPGAARAVFPVSRFLVDAERFCDDAEEPMAARGMGALYTVTTDLKPLRRFEGELRRRELMDRYYWPHHNGLDKTASEILAQHDRCLVIDCHSYPSRPLPYEMENQASWRPEIGIGSSKFHTPPLLLENIVGCFKDKGYEVGVDTPFSGALVPNAFYGRDKRISAFMIEVRKDLYMDETTGAKRPDFDKIRNDLTDVMSLAAGLV